jgi:hypothetical protein
VDKDILLHIIDGPGTGLTLMVLGFFALIAVLTVIRWTRGYDAAMQAGREAERRDGHDQLKVQVAKIMFDQQQLLNKLDYRNPAE